MADQYVLKTDDGVYFSLGEMNCLTVDAAKATHWADNNEAQKWVDGHAIYFKKLKDIGFRVRRRRG